MTDNRKESIQTMLRMNELNEDMKQNRERITAVLPEFEVLKERLIAAEWTMQDLKNKTDGDIQALYSQEPEIQISLDNNSVQAKRALVEMILTDVYAEIVYAEEMAKVDEDFKKEIEEYNKSMAEHGPMTKQMKDLLERSELEPERYDELKKRQMQAVNQQLVLESIAKSNKRNIIDEWKSPAKVIKTYERFLRRIRKFPNGQSMQIDVRRLSHIEKTLGMENHENVTDLYIYCFMRHVVYMKSNTTNDLYYITFAMLTLSELVKPGTFDVDADERKALYDGVSAVVNEFKDYL